VLRTGIAAKRAAWPTPQVASSAGQFIAMQTTVQWTHLIERAAGYAYSARRSASKRKLSIPSNRSPTRTRLARRKTRAPWRNATDLDASDVCLPEAGVIEPALSAWA